LIVSDRLASFFYGTDNQSLDQALLVEKERSVDLENLKMWARAEGFSDKLKQFLGILAYESIISVIIHFGLV
jgi:hypothetical protein